MMHRKLVSFPIGYLAAVINSAMITKQFELFALSLDVNYETMRVVGYIHCHETSNPEREIAHMF